MFLTKFPLNMTRRGTRQLLSSPYRLHAAIAGSFPDDTGSDDEGRVLWRIDRMPDGSACLYVVSPVVPSLDNLAEQAGWPDEDPRWQTRDYDPFLSHIEAGQLYGFRLTANPVVSRSGMRNSRGFSKRISHLTPLQQAAWLVGKSAYEERGLEPPEFLEQSALSRAERNGFSIVRAGDSGELQLTVSDYKKVDFYKGESHHKITLATARFDGVLEVINPNLIRHALVCGIGHGKGFGCGLLTLARVGAS